MVRPACQFLALVVSIVVSGCAGLTQLQHSVSVFNQATHEAAAAERSFLDAVMTVDCQNQFYTSAYNYSISKEPQANFDLAGYCTPRLISQQQIDTRNQLMNAIILYADKVQALASDQDDKKLDASAETMAKGLNKLVKAGGIKLANPSLVKQVEAAVTAISEMALDEVKYKNVRSAAVSVQPGLVVIVEALKQENFGFGQSMSAAIGDLEQKLRIEIAMSRQHQFALSGSGDQAGIFFNIVRSRNILAAADPLTRRALASAANLPGASVTDPATPVNDTLQAVVDANQALVDARVGGIYSAAHDLASRAGAAKKVYDQINGK